MGFLTQAAQMKHQATPQKKKEGNLERKATIKQYIKENGE